MNAKTLLVRNLASAMLATEWSFVSLRSAAMGVLGVDKPPPWLSACIDEILASWPPAVPPSHRTLAKMIACAPDFDDVWRDPAKRPRLAKIVTARARFAPIANFEALGLPEFTQISELADWLGISVGMLQWLADAEGYRTRGGTANHYSHAWIARRTGPPRLIEAPKPILKDLQRQILRSILDRVPIHDAAHGYRPGRSCRTAAQIHAGEVVVLCADLKDFFLSVPLGRVHATFRSLGYPAIVASVLTGLCSTATPHSVLAGTPEGLALDGERRGLYEQRHLPQGAPTSPALANFCAWRFDCRLEALAQRLDARYTRYGDDLAFSGGAELARRVDRVVPLLHRIALDCGFRLNPRKTRVMTQGRCQRLLGLVINQHINVPRERYERLKAILHNCRRHGPSSQNRDSHPRFRDCLQGEVAWVESVNPRKGLRLRAMFDAVDWTGRQSP